MVGPSNSTYRFERVARHPTVVWMAETESGADSGWPPRRSRLPGVLLPAPHQSDTTRNFYLSFHPRVHPRVYVRPSVSHSHSFRPSRFSHYSSHCSFARRPFTSPAPRRHHPKLISTRVRALLLGVSPSFRVAPRCLTVVPCSSSVSHHRSVHLPSIPLQPLLVTLLVVGSSAWWPYLSGTAIEAGAYTRPLSGST